MQLLPRLVGLCALSLSAAATAAPVINSVITSYSATGVPNSITIFGTGLCAATNCSTKPTVTLGGAVLSPVSGSVTGIMAPLGLISDGDYVLKLTAGSSSTTYNLTIKSNSAAGSGATISVGSTVTGASGTAASVTNTGTATAAVLNFVVPQGPAGPQGPVGNTGAQGIQGVAGLPGQQGPQGLKGDTGATGPAGAQGPVGAIGPQGPMGLQGPKGDKGDTGPAGNDGAVGPAGTMAPGDAIGDTQFWNGTTWAKLPIGQNGQTLKVCAGMPTWVTDVCPGVVSPVGLVLRLDFNEAPVQQVVMDSKPVGALHNGINNGAIWVQSVSDARQTPMTRTGVMRFDSAVRSQIVVAPAADMDAQSGTISFWMKTGGMAWKSIFFDRRNAAGDLVGIDLQSKIFHQATSARGVERNVGVTTSAFNDGLWHHIAYIYDQAVGGRVDIYIDGVLSVSGVNTDSWSWEPTREWQIGLSSDLYWGPFDGYIDDFRIYTRPMTSSEVQALYQGQ